MSISYMEIDTQQLRTDIRSLEDNIGRLEKSLENMMSDLEGLNAMWTGRANQAFRAQVSQDRSFMEDTLRHLIRLTECMTYAEKEYVRCENEVKSLADSIRI